MIDEWQKVEDYTARAKCVAFDGCHKIYVAMDQKESDYFMKEYAENWQTFAGSSDAMYSKVRSWFEESCGLRFVSAVKSGKFTTLVPQNY